MDENIQKISKLITEDPDVFGASQTEAESEIDYILALVYNNLFEGSGKLFERAQDIAEHYGPEMIKGKDMSSAAAHAMSIFKSDINDLASKHGLIDIMTST